MHIMKRSRFHILACLVMMAGCSSPDPLVGTGPVALGPAAKQAFGEYQTRAFPRFFAVSQDGSAFYYNYCPAASCERMPKSQIVSQCESYSGGIPCKIYARNGDIVWTDDS